MPMVIEKTRPARASSSVYEGAAEIAVQRAPDEEAELLPERPVEAEALGDGVALDLVGVGAR
jgi:hypothetical protein